jgi:hypothetical protein
VWLKARRKYSLKNIAGMNASILFTRYDASNILLKVMGFGV